MSNKYISIITTTPNKKLAIKISDALVAEKLAACSQIIGPTTSIYSWKGKKVKTNEWMCLIKAKAETYGKIEKEIKKLHAYKIPEIVSIDISKGNRDYLNWIDSYTKN